VLLDGFEHQFSAGRWPNDHIWGDQNGQPLTKEDLEALIVMAAHDAGLTEANLVSAESIRHCYLVYLVEQGMRLADLETITGPMAPRARAAYAVHAPAGAAVSLDQVETVHPALRKAFAY